MSYTASNKRKQMSHGSANGIKSVLVNSADTDAFINLIYHFKLSFDIDELYVTIGGTKRTRKTVPLHGCSLCLLIDLALFGPLLHSLYNRDWPTRGGRRSVESSSYALSSTYKLAQQLNPMVIDCLPAIHALTGCDTTSKVGTKGAVFKKSVDFDLIKYENIPTRNLFS